MLLSSLFCGLVLASPQPSLVRVFPADQIPSYYTIKRQFRLPSNGDNLALLKPYEWFPIVAVGPVKYRLDYQQFIQPQGKGDVVVGGKRTVNFEIEPKGVEAKRLTCTDGKLEGSINATVQSLSIWRPKSNLPMPPGVPENLENLSTPLWPGSWDRRWHVEVKLPPEGIVGIKGTYELTIPTSYEPVHNLAYELPSGSTGPKEWIRKITPQISGVYRFETNCEGIIPAPNRGELKAPIPYEVQLMSSTGGLRFTKQATGRYLIAVEVSREFTQKNGTIEVSIKPVGQVQRFATKLRVRHYPDPKKHIEISSMMQ